MVPPGASPRTWPRGRRSAYKEHVAIARLVPIGVGGDRREEVGPLATTFDKIMRAGRPVKGQRMPDTGQLVVDGDAMEFRGKKETIRMAGVRDIRVDGATVAVVFGEPVAVEKFMDLRRGRLRTTPQAKVLTQDLRAALGLGAPPAPSGEVARVQANAATAAGRRTMLIAALFLVGGILVTVITYSRASSGGGTYFVAWGAMLWGLVYFFVGLAQYLKGSKAQRESGGPTPPG